MDYNGTDRHGSRLPDGSDLPKIGGSPSPVGSACAAGGHYPVTPHYRPASGNCEDASSFLASVGDGAPHPSLIQRCAPQNTAIIAKVDNVTTNFGETDAPHTPTEEGCTLPGSDRRPAPTTFDDYQNIGNAQAAAGGAGRAAGGNGLSCNTPGFGQRPQPLEPRGYMNRAQHLRDLLAAIEEWSHASGVDRDYWRGIALYRIAAFRRLHLAPERAAFAAAVRNHQHRKAA